MTKNVEVLPIGTVVKIGGDIDAIITAVSIRGLEHSIAYECQWTNDSVKTQWIDEIMVQPQEKIEKSKIGFNNTEV
jgi:hypothetical protein